ncbi:MAG: 16S rRNA (uracil(1498)-N(3))-methyltransferase [Treponema sp.]|nr:16S rRNA (uracil(1498)-N(3))-methyltransferase [Treponema sp.]
MRQFIASEGLGPSGTLAVTGKDFRYLKQVLRIKTGDMLNVRLPDGSLVDMTACTVDASSKTVILQLCSTLKDNSSARVVSEEGSLTEKPEVELWLFQFVAKAQKMDLIIRQAVECGVSVIVPVTGEYSQKINTSSRDDRWGRIIREARSQCGSAVDTKVTDALSVKEAMELWKRHLEEKSFVSGSDNQDSLAVVLYERSEGTRLLHEVCSSYKGLPKIASIAVGAEGGISPAEIELMKNYGFNPIHFITNILRCETAALYGLATLQTTLMEKKVWQCKE